MGDVQEVEEVEEKPRETAADRVLAAYQSLFEANGFPPSMSQVGDELGVSKAAVGRQAKALAAKGLLRQMAGQGYYIPA